MLLYLTQYLTKLYSGFNVFNYLTLRAILAAITALLISFIVGPRMIRAFTERQIGQQVRSDGPQSHLSKKGTPTMGGALILVAIAAGTLLWSDLGNRYVWIVILTTLAFGLIGFAAHRYGKRMERPRTKWLGIALMLYPYAIAQTWLLYVVGAALCAGLYVDRV